MFYPNFVQLDGMLTEPRRPQCRYQNPSEVLQDLQTVRVRFSDLRLYVDFYCKNFKKGGFDVSGFTAVNTGNRDS